MKIRVLDDADAVAEAGAAFIADSARSSVAARGNFTLALSGGRTPWEMLRRLTHEDVPWQHVRILQVDERVAPAASPERNLTRQRATLVAGGPLPPDNLYAMSVEDEDLAAAAASYAATLEALCGSPPVLDLIHLGLGADGHTASLVPGDPVLELSDTWVAITGVYRQHRRMTLTYPVLDRARAILFVVTGSEKSEALVRLLRRDRTSPAGRVAGSDIVVLADRAAASRLERPLPDLG